VLPGFGPGRTCRPTERKLGPVAGLGWKALFGEFAIYSAVARKNDFALTGLHATTGLCGSVVIGLALAETVLPAEKAWQCAILDEMYQAEQWGVDADAEQRWKAMRDEIAAATLFMDLSGD
jgi:chaperone required for assembly of F1-ATPase